MKVLVTGGSGFIGSHVVDQLAEAGHKPVIYDRRPSPFRDDIQTELGELSDLTRLELAMSGCDAVMHLAAAADVNEVAKMPVESEAANARGTINVLEAARGAGVKRVVYASTIWVYTGESGERVDEESNLGMPNHLYTASKLAGEMYCRSYNELYELEFTVLRFGIPYGPRARPAAVVPAFVGKAMAGEALTVAGAGDQSRRFVYVEDLAAGCVKALDPVAANRTYNLVSDSSVTILEIAELVQQLVAPTGIEYTEQRTADYVGVEVSGVRAEQELGWTAKTSFADGVSRYVEWRREDEAAAPAAIKSAAKASEGFSAALTRVRRSVAMPFAYAIASLAMLAAYVAAVDSLGLPDAQVGTLAVTMIASLAVFLLIELMWRNPNTRTISAVSSALVTALFIFAVMTPWGHHLFHLATPGRSLFVLTITGVALVIALASAGIALARRRGLIDDTAAARLTA
jgi:UDP-glucose 4-epimerase